MKKKNVKVAGAVENCLAEYYRNSVSEQYRVVCEKTGEFFREVVKFGALLNQVEAFIGGEARREGSGLKGWMEENFPEINYKTAQGYKAMAAKCAQMIGGGTQAMACLLGVTAIVEPASQELIDVDASFVEKREALFEQVDSRRKLEQMWFEFMAAAKRPGRPAGVVSEYRKKSSLECAVEAVWPTVQHLLKHRGEMFTAYKILPDDKLHEIQDTLGEHVKAIEAVLGGRS